MTVAVAFTPFIVTSLVNQNYGTTVVVFAVIGSALLCTLLSRRGYVNGGVGLLISVLLLAGFPPVLGSTGTGTLIAFIIFAGVQGIALLTLSPRWLRGVSLGSGVVALLIALVDAFGSANRPATINIWIGMGGGIAFAALYLLALFYQFRNLSLRAKLVTMFVLVTFLSISLLTTITNQLTRSQLANAVGAGLQSAARTQGILIGNALEYEMQQLQALALNPTLQQGLETIAQNYQTIFNSPAAVRADITRLDGQWRNAHGRLDHDDPLVRARLANPVAATLNQYRNEFPEHLDLLVTDAYGAIVATTYLTPKYDHSGEVWWQLGYGNSLGGKTISPSEFDQRNFSLNAALIVPVYKRGASDVIGVIRSHFRLKTLADLATTTRLGETGRADLYLPNGEKFAQTGLRSERGEISTETLGMLRLSEANYHELNLKDIPTFVSYAPVRASSEANYIRDLYWAVIVSQERQESFQVITAQNRTSTLVTILIIVIAVLAATGLAQAMVGSVTRLTRGAEQISAGDLNARAPVESRDEVGTLAVTFNDMTSQLQQTLRTLEQRVEERTEALRESNRALAAENAERQRAEETLRHQTTYLTALHETALQLASRLEVNELLRDILLRAGQLVGAPHGYLYLLQPSNPLRKSLEGQPNGDGEYEEMQMRVGTGSQAALVGNRIQRGMGLAGRVWETGQSLVVNDYQNWPGRLSTAAGMSSLRAVVGVPLVSASAEGDKAEVVGVLGLAHTVKGREFGEEDVEVLRRFAPLTSLALENARLFAQTENTLKETTHLFEASRRIAAATDLQSIVAAVVEGAAAAASPATDNLLGQEQHTSPPPIAKAINRAILILFERDVTGRIIAGESVANWHSGQGRGPNPIGRRYPVEVFQIAPILFSPEPLFFEDAYHDPRIDAATRVLVLQQKVRAFAVLPLWSSGQQLGILVIQADEPHRFTPQEIRPYLSLTQQLAVAIENRRLLAQAQQALAQAERLAQREQTIGDATAHLQQTSTVRDTLQVAAQQLQKATGSARVVMRLQRPSPEPRKRTAHEDA
jgi:GAF domain-containing protein/HAMP domain-containing protein